MDGPFHLSRVPRNQEHLTLVNLITLGETLPEFIEADKVLPRLVSEVRDLEAQLQREIDSASRAEQDRRDAIEAARAEALAEIDARFAEPEPEPPTPPEPEKPFRGKVTRETAEV
jgi:flagellar biosynthesis/type III secretory pathway protein FliH